VEEEARAIRPVKTTAAQDLIDARRRHRSYGRCSCATSCDKPDLLQQNLETWI
jgi:hypothetical protein